MKKKILLSLMLILNILLLSSCVQTTWEEFPTNLIDNAGVYEDYGNNNNYVLYITLNVPQEVFEEADEYNIALDVVVFLNITYYDYNEMKYSMIEDFAFEARITESGPKKYKMEVELSTYLDEENFNGKITSVKVDSAIYSVSLMIGPAMESDEVMYKIVLNFGISILCAFAAYLITAVILGIIVNRSLTKKYKKIQDDKQFK